MPVEPTVVRKEDINKLRPKPPEHARVVRRAEQAEAEEARLGENGVEAAAVLPPKAKAKTSSKSKD